MGCCSRLAAIFFEGSEAANEWAAAAYDRAAAAYEPAAAAYPVAYPKLKLAVCTLFNAVYKAITFCLSVVQFQLQQNIGTIRINIKIRIKCLSWNLGLQRFDLGSYQNKT